MPREALNFKAICERAPIVKVAQFLNLEMKRETDGFRTSCPFHKNDKHTIKITPGFRRKNGVLGSFYCHGCKVDGDAIGLYAHITNCRNYDAALAISEHFGIGNNAEDTSTSPPPQRGEPEGRRDALKPLDYLLSNHPVVEAIGVPAAAIAAIEGGFAPRGTMKGRFLIPLRLPDGTLVGYCGIATRPEQMPLLDFPKNLAERCGAATPPSVQDVAEETQEEPSPEQLRKLFRVV